MTMKPKDIFLATLLFVALVAFVPFFIAWIWNGIFTTQLTLYLFGVAKLTWIKALGLSVLCGVLVRGSK